MKLEAVQGTQLDTGKQTCFGSLSWCCKTSSPCMFRDMSLKQAGISKKEYMRLKRDLSDTIMSRVFHDSTPDEPVERAQTRHDARGLRVPESRVTWTAAMTILIPVLSISLHPRSFPVQPWKKRSWEQAGSARSSSMPSGTPIRMAVVIRILVHSSSLSRSCMAGIFQEPMKALEKTDVSDAVAFYKAFAMTAVTDECHG